MRLSGCLKVQIDDKPAQIFVVTDLVPNTEYGTPLSEDNARLVSLMSNVFAGRTSWHDTLLLPIAIADYTYIGDYRLGPDNLSYVGYTFDQMKYLLADEVIATDEFAIKIYDATPETLQSVINDVIGDGQFQLVINTAPSVVKFLKCTPAEIENLYIGDQIAPHVDAYDYLLSSLVNTSAEVESMGFVKARHESGQECVVFNTQCSFTMRAPELSNT
ncbi:MULTISPECIES: hypothetical protein [unclassified Psychrobacter]|uniref:hypothetical protein n=1 Tax=unclassified Psychrobacter TaxID=196806 RepID=UPI0018F4DBA5|nr:MULTISPECIES: hypothetical protein [unclassified Psychrobacter]